MLIALAVFVGFPFLLPERAIIPVEGATVLDWNQNSFWYEPWGASGVHKGIDIFAPKGRAVVAPVYGVVVYKGQLGIGGNVVAVLGPKWRVHYFAHLDSASAQTFDLVLRGEEIGSVGTSGNAAGKPPHLHYSVLSMLPLPWRATAQTQGWKRMFFVDPAGVLATKGR
jgi:peptidoglycan LD-endopeptidase LytH